MKTLIRGTAVGLALALSAQVAQAQTGMSFGLWQRKARLLAGVRMLLKDDQSPTRPSTRANPASARSSLRSKRQTAARQGDSCQ